MVYAMRSKKSLSGKPRVSSASAGRKKEGFKSRRNKYESDDDDNDSYVTKPTRSFSNRKTGENSFSRPKPYGDTKGRGFIRGSSGASRELRGEQRPKWGPPKNFGGDGGREMRGEQRPKWGPRKDIGGDGSGEKRGREMRGEQRPKWGARKDYSGKDGFVEASDAKLRSKWKRMDKKGRGGDDLDDKRGSRGSQHTDRKGGKGRGKGFAEEGILEKDAESEEGEVVEKKFIKRQRVIDKTGKKIRIAQKHDDGSEAKDAPPKRKKRVIKLDPYDFSNKRIDDTVPSSAADAIANSADDVAEKDEKDNEISKNAQFRAIQPTSSILSFVEDNLIGRRRLSELKNAGYNTKISAPLDNTPFTTSLERDRIEENVFRNKLEFFAAAKISSSFPPPMIPEIAFAGRSNVGKSSLLNALSRQWGVVRTSDKPGLTQTINFFKLGPKLSLVDLPGYGFAYAKEEVKEAWEDLVKEYVSTRVGLQKVCLLIDTKWGMKPRDYELIDLMERSKTPYQVVLTKTDVIFPIDVARRAMQIQETLKKNKSIVNPVMMVSSKSGAGIRSLRTVLAKVARFVKP